MEETPVRALEVVLGRRDAPEGNARDQAEGGDGLRKASETVALVCAGALAGVVWASQPLGSESRSTLCHAEPT